MAIARYLLTLNFLVSKAARNKMKELEDTNAEEVKKVSELNTEANSNQK